MKIITSESIRDNSEQKKYFLLCETTEEGIKQFKASSSESKQGVTISKMLVYQKPIKQERHMISTRFKTDINQPGRSLCLVTAQEMPYQTQQLIVQGQ